MLLLVATIIYQGQVLYPYYCTKTWVCDYVSEEAYRAQFRKQPRKPARR